jgi:hypothetical protein
MKYRVHVYGTFHAPFDVEADSHEAAMKAAESLAVPQFDNGTVRGLEYADEISGFLVDENGDEEHERSRTYNAECKREAA